MKKRSEPLVSVSYLCRSYLFLILTYYLQGFYSLFSVTEEPFVRSGGKFNIHLQVAVCSCFPPDKWMGFYWKDKRDQVAAIPYSPDYH